MIQLGVNIDHVATLRQVRGTAYPDPVRAALLAEQAGADAVTLHLREDRRHIQERDVEQIRARSTTRMNLESAITAEMIAFALRVGPHDVCLVPEKRRELTTEGGLDVAGSLAQVTEAVRALEEAGIRVSLFVDPERQQIEAAHACRARVVELHTGCYAGATQAQQRGQELVRLRDAARHAASLGLRVNAGHGLHYDNVQDIAAIPEIGELNIGHAIVAEALFTGWVEAVGRMKRLMLAAR